MIVFADADIERAVQAVASGVFYNMGQTCTAGTRLYVDARVAENVLDRIAAAARSLRLGPGLDPRTQIGPFVSEEQLQRVSGYVEAGVRDGAALIAGGRRCGDAGYYYEPTILANTHARMSVARLRSFIR